MNNRTTQRLVDQNVARHLVEEQRSREGRLQMTASTSVLANSQVKLGLWSGFVALLMHWLSLIGL